MTSGNWVRPTLTIGDDREPWERLDGESPRAFAAFAAYRDLGVERSLRKVHRDTGHSMGLLSTWSSHNRWVVRAEAWDRHLDAEKRKAIKARQERALDDQATVAQAVLGIVAQRLAAMKPEQLRSGDIPRFLMAAATVQRAALGIPTKIDTTATLSVDGKIQLEDLTAGDRLAAMFDAYAEGLRDAHRHAAEGEEPLYPAAGREA